jgi:hypothetical protein
MCSQHSAQGDEEHIFFGLASEPRSTFSPGLTSKLVAMAFWFGSQNQGQWFGDLGLKITTMISWFGPQKQV